MFARFLLGSLALAAFLTTMQLFGAQSADPKATSAATPTEFKPNSGGSVVNNAGGNATPDASEVVARVNDKPILRLDVDRGVAAAVGSQKVDPTILPTLQATVLKQLIDNYLLNEFMLSQKDLVTGADLNAAMTEIRNGLRKQNTTLEAFLASQKMTESALKSQLVGQIMVQKYAAMNTTEEGLQKYFDEHKELFDGTERRISHVLLRPDGPADEAVVKALVEEAKKLREQLQSGQLKFDEAAGKYSAGPSRQRGGDLGYVPRAGVMAAAFTQAAYALKPDEISEPVATPFGIHLIKVTEIKAGAKKLADVQATVQRAYSQYLIEKLIDDQEKAAKIEFVDNYPHFKPGTRDLVTPGQTDASPKPEGAAGEETNLTSP